MCLSMKSQTCLVSDSTNKRISFRLQDALGVFRRAKQIFKQRHLFSYLLIQVQSSLASAVAFEGPLPSCSPRSCDFAFPTGIGVQHDCNGRKTGENCTAQCGEERKETSMTLNHQKPNPCRYIRHVQAFVWLVCLVKFVVNSFISKTI